MNNLDDKWLWVDPLADRIKYGEVLLADVIRIYAEEYKLLIQTDFDEKNLKGACYNMSAADNDGWLFIDTGCKAKVRLKIEHDPQRGRYYVVPSNTFAFIRLKEKLRLPFYIIGRHNLQIPYVYQGLLLGTGPQIDPGYSGQIYIPLHNFTNQDVNVYINEAFVSMDFSRTTPVTLKPNTPAPNDINDFYLNYASFKPIDREKIKRNLLADYLKENRPTSSLASLVEDLKRYSKEFAAHKFLDLAVFGVIATLMIAILGVLINFIEPTHQRIDGLIANVCKLEYSSMDVNANQKRLDSKIDCLEKELNDLKASKPEKPTVNIKH